jgi:putative transposase
MAAFFDRHNPADRPSWRKAGRNEGFRIVGRRGHKWDVRWSRPVPPGVKSYRVTMDRAGRWHVAFAAIPKPLTAPGNGQIVGVDRGVAVSAALSTGELLRVPHPGTHEHKRVLRLQRRLARAKRGSNRRRRVRLTLARLKARQADRRKDWAEKISTDLARRFDLIRVEDLDVKSMTRSARGTPQEPGRNVRQKAGLNRSIRASGWGGLVRRMYDKAPGRVEKIRPAFTSQRCSVCGHVAAESRKSQALFACNFTLNADVNAARNIAAGHAVTARGGDGVTRPRNREPQLLLPPV